MQLNLENKILPSLLPCKSYGIESDALELLSTSSSCLSSLKGGSVSHTDTPFGVRASRVNELAFEARHALRCLPFNVLMVTDEFLKRQQNLMFAMSQEVGQYRQHLADAAKQALSADMVPTRALAGIESLCAAQG